MAEPRRKASEETKPTSTLPWDFQPSELLRNKCLLSKLPCPWLEHTEADRVCLAPMIGDLGQRYPRLQCLPSPMPSLARSAALPTGMHEGQAHASSSEALVLSFTHRKQSLLSHFCCLLGAGCQYEREILTPAWVFFCFFFFY